MCFFRLVVTTAVLVWAVNRLGWLKRLCQHALKLGLASGGLVLTCSVMDMGATLLGHTTSLLVELTEPQIKLAILGGATAFLLVIAAPEGGSSNRVLHENLVIFSLHPPRSASSSPLAVHQEAGRLRRVRTGGGLQTTAESGSHSILQGFRSGRTTLLHQQLFFALGFVLQSINDSGLCYSCSMHHP